MYKLNKQLNEITGRTIMLFETKKGRFSIFYLGQSEEIEKKIKKLFKSLGSFDTHQACDPGSSCLYFNLKKTI